MDYINTVLNFLNANSVIILPILLATVILYGLANWLTNPYRKQNKKFAASYKSVCAYPDKVAKYAEKLPEDYRRQWRILLNCGSATPALVFEFVKKRKRARLLWLFVLAAIINVTYVAVFFVAERNFSYLIFQVVFWLAFGLVIVANKAVCKKQEKRARQIFAKFVTQVNRSAPLHSDTVDQTVKQLQQFNRHEVNDSVVGQASELLRNKGLDQNRSVEQQRKLNGALNGLLQAYSRGAQRNKV